MHLVSFCHKDKPYRTLWGVWLVEEEMIVDVCKVDSSLYSSLRYAIETKGGLVSCLNTVLEQAKDMPDAYLPFADCTLKAPYTNPPRNIICTGINYVAHLHEFTRSDAEKDIPKFPFLFTKPCTAIAHPESAVSCYPDHTQKYDYEVELAVIIGKEGRDIKEEDALDHVFGYSIINDLSARDLQRRTTQWYAGKSLDGSAPFGPCIVTKDEIQDPQNLKLESRINGEVRQSSHTSLMIFNVARLIHIISQGSTLLPGDIIATGTPSGVGMSFDPPKFLRSGDVMELEIENIGILKNTII